jgi:hypothetical protein
VTGLPRLFALAHGFEEGQERLWGRARARRIRGKTTVSSQCLWLIHLIPARAWVRDTTSLGVGASHHQPGHRCAMCFQKPYEVAISPQHGTISKTLQPTTAKRCEQKWTVLVLLREVSTSQPGQNGQSYSENASQRKQKWWAKAARIVSKQGSKVALGRG